MSEKKLMKFRILVGMHAQRTTYFRDEEAYPKATDQYAAIVKSLPSDVKVVAYADGQGWWSERTYSGPVIRNHMLVKHGDIIETTDDLLKLNGKPPCQPKFERVYQEQVTEQREREFAEIPDNLDILDETMLRKLADDEELDHSKLKTKPQLIKALRDSRRLVSQS